MHALSFLAIEAVAFREAGTRPRRLSPLRCVRAAPRLRSGIAILAVTDAIPVLAVISAFPVILSAVLRPTLRLRAVLLACRASPRPLLDAACAEK